MTQTEPVRAAPDRTRSPAPSAVPTMGITVYGCGRDEAVAFRELAPRYGVEVTPTAEVVSDANAGLAHGNRCVSVGHRAPVTNAA